jgi:hypothetical protein
MMIHSEKHLTLKSFTSFYFLLVILKLIKATTIQQLHQQSSITLSGSLRGSVRTKAGWGRVGCQRRKEVEYGGVGEGVEK